MNLMMSTTAQVVETSDCQQRYYNHPDDHSQPTFEKRLKSILKWLLGSNRASTARQLLFGKRAKAPPPET